MFIIKKHLATNSLKILSNILLFIVGIILVDLILGLVFVEKNKFNINMSLSFVVYLIYFFIIYNLCKVVYSTNLTPFCFENVRKFKTIGYGMFMIGILDGIINFKRKGGLELLATNYGSIKGSFIMYIVLAFMAFVLAEIFKNAVEIKEENDLTI
ncbi:MAG: DUF2975 domain-containing protein [Solirubrobacterales bacterium]